MTEEEQMALVAAGAESAARGLGWVPTRTLVLMEILNEDGRREICMAGSPELQAQDSLGLLMFALQAEQAAALG